MFVRFHERMKEREEGFTLIELLVVILIIAILAAIAIPVFLNQRKKGWVAQMESALKNAATAQESYLVGNNSYASSEAQLATEGWKKATAVTVHGITFLSGNEYCVAVVHATLSDGAIEPMAISSSSTTPTKDRDCPAGTPGIMGTAAAAGD